MIAVPCTFNRFSYCPLYSIYMNEMKNCFNLKDFVWYFVLELLLFSRKPCTSTRLRITWRWLKLLVSTVLRYLKMFSLSFLALLNKIFSLAVLNEMFSLILSFVNKMFSLALLNTLKKLQFLKSISWKKCFVFNNKNVLGKNKCTCI